MLSGLVCGSLLEVADQLFGVVGTAGQTVANIDLPSMRLSSTAISTVLLPSTASKAAVARSRSSDSIPGSSISSKSCISSASISGNRSTNCLDGEVVRGEGDFQQVQVGFRVRKVEWGPGAGIG